MKLSSQRKLNIALYHLTKPIPKAIYVFTTIYSMSFSFVYGYPQGIWSFITNENMFQNLASEAIGIFFEVIVVYFLVSKIIDKKEKNQWRPIRIRAAMDIESALTAVKISILRIFIQRIESPDTAYNAGELRGFLNTFDKKVKKTLEQYAYAVDRRLVETCDLMLSYSTDIALLDNEEFTPRITDKQIYRILENMTNRKEEDLVYYMLGN